MATRRPPRRTRYHHGDLKRALVDAAADLVSAHGAKGFSLREAARAVGVDPAACYRHFASREALLCALATRGFGALARVMAEAKAGAPTPEAALIAMGNAYVRFAVAHPPEFRVMFGDSGADARDPRLRPEDVERTGYELLEDTVREWRAANPGPAAAAELTLLLWASVHGLARLLVDGAVRLEIEDAARAVAQLAVAVLESGRAAERPRRQPSGGDQTKRRAPDAPSK